MTQIEIHVPEEQYPELYKGQTYQPITEFTVIEWFAGVGDTVTEDQSLATCESSKGAADVLAPVSGTLIEIRSAEHEAVNRESDSAEYPALGVIETDPGAVAKVVKPEAEVPGATPVAQRIMNAENISGEEVLKYVPTLTGPGGKIGKDDVEVAVAAVPAARAKARELDVDINTVKGSGPDDVVLLTDVEQAPKEPKDDTPVTDVDNPMAVDVLKPSPLRLATAQIMQDAMDIPIAGPTNPYNLDVLVHFRKTYGLPLWFPLMASLVRVLHREQFKTINARWNKGDKTIECYRNVNIGIAVDRGEGLRIFVVHKADRMDLLELEQSVRDLFDRIKEDKTTVEDQRGATFLFNNIGALGHTKGHSLFPPWMAGIWNLGVLDEDHIAEMSFLFDHRIVDGGFATEFMDAVLKGMYKGVIPELSCRLTPLPLPPSPPWWRRALKGLLEGEELG